jgi:ABC-2 type transport system permease protein
MKRELRLLARDTGLWVIVCVYSILLAYGSLQGVSGYRESVRQIAQTRSEYDQRWAAMTSSAVRAKDEIWGSWKSASLAGSEQGGAVAWLDPLPTSVLNLGHAARENPVRRISLYDSPASPPLANPLNAVYGAMDLGFVVLWILPLMAFLMAHLVLGSDWEAGVWPLICVSGVSLYRLVLVRLAVPFGILSLLSIAAALVSIAMTSMRYDGKLLMWILAMALYAATWIALGGWLGLGARSPSRQLLMAGTLWLASVWVVPGLIDSLTELAVPRVSAADGLLAARDAQISPAQRGIEVMRRVYSKNPEWQPSQELVKQMNTPVPGGPRKRDARNVYSNYLVAQEAAAPSRDRISARRRHVEDLAHRFSFVSPLVAMQYLTEEVAGNSYDRYREFGDRAELFLTEWRAYFARKVWRLEEMQRSDIEQRPKFQPETREGVDLPQRLALPFGGLAVWFAGVCAALYWRVRHFSLAQFR